MNGSVGKHIEEYGMVREVYGMGMKGVCDCKKPLTSAVTRWCKLTSNIAQVGRPSTDICRLHKLTSKRNYLINM